MKNRTIIRHLLPKAFLCHAPAVYLAQIKSALFIAEPAGADDVGGQESRRPSDCPCWEEARSLLAGSEIRLRVCTAKGRGVGWGSAPPSPRSCRGGERVCYHELSCRRLDPPRRGRTGGDVLAFALGGGAQAVGWPARPTQGYMRDALGMVRDARQGALDVKELRLDGAERVGGKSAFPRPCPHAISACGSSLLTNRNHQCVSLI